MQTEVFGDAFSIVARWQSSSPQAVPLSPCFTLAAIAAGPQRPGSGKDTCPVDICCVVHFSLSIAFSSNVSPRVCPIAVPASTVSDTATIEILIMCPSETKIISTEHLLANSGSLSRARDRAPVLKLRCPPASIGRIRVWLSAFTYHDLLKLARLQNVLVTVCDPQTSRRSIFS